MEIAKRPRGRPPATPQTLPLFLHDLRSRVKQQLIISAPMARELRAYAGWAGQLIVMAPDEVLVRAVDRALDEYFKRDKLWRRDRVEVLARRDVENWRAGGWPARADERADAIGDGRAADTSVGSSPAKTGKPSCRESSATANPGSRVDP